MTRDHFFSNDAIIRALGGNVMSWQADEDRHQTKSHIDYYRCDCGNLVDESEWDFNTKQCKGCKDGIKS